MRPSAARCCQDKGIHFMFGGTHHGRQLDFFPPTQTATYEKVTFSENEVIVLMCIGGCD